MKIAVVGGGPAGLYFSALMARSGGHQIEVFERNPPAATYGWGVVFSEGTLAELAGGHDRLFEDLDKALIRWSTITIHRPDSTVRATGQPFAAIDRKSLLSILARWAEAHGLSPRYETEFRPGDEGGFDLVVAADGVNSTWRRHYSESFRSKEIVHATRYIWLGLEQGLSGFTFVFEPTSAGLFQAHAYPYGPGESTFIIETTEESFQESELQGATEEQSIRFGEKLFANFLGPARLRSNRSQWLRFVTLRNQRWFRIEDVPVVLVGDAAHTAHFSIGSGTKLAMEDAAALHNALLSYPGDLASALATYESNRQPPVARFQEAAIESARYFERVSNLMDLPDASFALNLLTRSGRVSYVDVERSDPSLASAVGRLTSPDGEIAVPALTHLTIGRTVFRNRLVGPGGFVMSPSLAVSLEGRHDPLQPTSAETSSAWEGVVLTHAGPRASCRPAESGLDRPLLAGGWQTIAASSVRYTSAHSPSRQMSTSDMDRVIADFVNAAQVVRRGVTLVMIDSAQGNLLASFVSPLTNFREDGYGGSIESRLRFPLAVVTAVREVWEATMGVRLSATDFSREGITEEDAVSAARAFAARGVDLIEVCGGGAVAEYEPPYRRGYLLPLAATIRLRAGVRVLVGGGLTTLDDANTAVGSGRTDLVRMSWPASDR
ncbi:MAG TPA: FAD-dependent monooxygenase [Acidimicrobiia bacterium]|nr:FAD-dependent monooxygenase [Acidimicrobiia bacterium]